MFDITQLVGIPQLGVHSSLERLAEVFQEAAAIKGQKVPVVSIYLKSGQYIQGYLICFNSGPEKKSILVANYRASEDAAQDLTYIFVDEIAGLTVHEADTVVDQLSSGQINISLKKTPTVEEIQSQIQNFLLDFNKRFNAKVGCEIAPAAINTQEKSELEALYFGVTDWTRAMRKHANDEIAQQSFKDNPYNFIFSFGATAKIESQDGTNIRLVIGLDSDKVDRVSRFAIETTLKEFV